MALELIKTQKSVKQVADELGVGTSLLYYWRKCFLESGQDGFKGEIKINQSAEGVEIARLKKELKEVEIERDILKKAVSIFSKSDVKSTGL